VQPNVAHAEIVVAEGQRILEHLVQANGDALRLVLARKAQEILHDSVSALRLLVELFAVFQTLRTDLAA